MISKTVIIICGPTAVGKTSLAIWLANYYNTQIISADSKQCYKELNIGVAKPSQQQLNEVPHHFINSHSIHDDVNAAVFEHYATNAAKEILTNNNIAIMVGGTGLYIKAFTDGLDHIPPIPSEVKQDVITKYNELGLSWLQSEVKNSDPVFWDTAEQLNPHRLIRALEINYATGKSVTHFRKGGKKELSFNIFKIGLELPKEQLHHNINTRTDKMVAEGLTDEAHLLLPYRNLSALQTVGYRELFDYFEGGSTLEQAIINIKTNTRRYAKRQMTWFKKDGSIVWHAVGEHTASEIINQIKQ